MANLTTDKVPDMRTVLISTQYQPKEKDTTFDGQWEFVDCSGERYYREDLTEITFEDGTLCANEHTTEYVTDDDAIAEARRAYDDWTAKGFTALAERLERVINNPELLDKEVPIVQAIVLRKPRFIYRDENDMEPVGSLYRTVLGGSK